MTTPYRSLLRNALLVVSTFVAALSAPWPCASAQDVWPNKPVRVVIPFGPGSATDIVARAVSEELRNELGQAFVVENRAGANGFIAAETVARAAPDGYTLFITSSTTHTTNQFLFKKLPYDPVNDFIPIGGIIEAYYVMTTPLNLPVSNVAELVSWLKANSTKASYGWGATISQIAGTTFLKDIGVSAAGVAYKSSPQAVADLIGGQLSFVVQDVTTALAHIRNGRVKALMVSAPQRIPQLANIPTGAEVGMPGFDASTYVGMLAPAGTPEPVVSKLSAALQRVLKNPNIIQNMDSCCSSRMFPSTPAEFDAYLKQDRIKWQQKISRVGLEAQ
ncbi:MAG: tripartite tricarboxylate transporter substrate binding protein [Betaproteobacteria bacterium]|nr:tripartite tricarboxylate transporter substrate binding protein [Betaproteobacteria bacterium]